jgi:hypothetical protein
VSGYILSVDADFDLDDVWEYIAADSIDAADNWIRKNCSIRLKRSGKIPAWDTGARTWPPTRFCSGRSAHTSSFIALNADQSKSWRRRRVPATSAFLSRRIRD